MKEYQSMVDYYDDIKGYFYADEPPVKRRFMLSYRSYFNQFPDNIKKRVRRKKEDLDYFSERPFYILFNDFFEEIVSGIYNKTVISKSGRVEDNSLIHAIQPMDTRHFAIMNMVLSGIEPTIIKELAGHSNIDTTYGYSRHAKEYAKNLILSMAKKQSKDGMVDYAANQVLCADGVQEMTTSKKRYVLARLKDKEYASQFRKVADGYCLYTKDDIVPCILCAGNHKRCSHYIVNESVGFTNLLQEHKDMHEEMNAEIETLNWVISNHDKIENWADRFKASLSKIKSYMNKEVGFRAEYQVFEKFN